MSNEYSSTFVEFNKIKKWSDDKYYEADIKFVDVYIPYKSITDNSAKSNKFTYEQTPQRNILNVYALKW